MARINYADPEMIREINELRKRGIKRFICDCWTDTKFYKPVIKGTAQGISAYANAMFAKHGDSTTVVVSYLDKEFKLHEYCTYHA